MLNFLKKSGRSLSNDDKFIPQRLERNSMVSSWHLTDNTPLDENLGNHEINAPLEPRSRLSMNLYDIVTDRTCLSYFIQFLETKNALSLIKFYLDSESFKSVAEKDIASLENNNYYNYGNNYKRYRTKSISSDNFDKISLNSSNFDVSDSISIGSQLTNVTMNCEHLMSNSSMSLDEKLEEEIINEVNEENESNEKNEVNFCSNKNCNISNLKTVPELKTLCDLTLRKPLTDDEKTMLVLAENNKNFHNSKLSKSISANNFNEKLTSNGNFDNYKLNIYNKEMQLKHQNVWTSIATDAIRIYRKYLVSNSIHFIDIPATILSTISLQICTKSDVPSNLEKNEKNNTDINNLISATKTNDKIDTISAKCFYEAQKYVLERLETDYLNEFLESPFYCKYIVDILTNTRSLTISDILHSESALFYFMEYLEQQENHRDLLEFWVSAMNFRKHYLNLLLNSDENLDLDNNSEDLLRTDAMILYDKYFSLQANNPLPISRKVRSQIEEKICSNEEEDICKAFDIAIKIVEIYFEKVYFQQFLSSPLFLNYLNDLKSKIPDYKTQEHRNSHHVKNSFKTVSNSRHRKALSDCSAENTQEIRRRFLSHHNSLPVSGIENSKFKTSKSADMKIDSRHLNDPDLLWQRNSRNGLIFGRVDSLGRYERDFEVNFNTEDKWTLANGSYKLKNAMRKFVNLPEDKVQEEIAWQIAEMIVKDITSVTLGNDENDNGTV